MGFSSSVLLQIYVGGTQSPHAEVLLGLHPYSPIAHSLHVGFFLSVRLQIYDGIYLQLSPQATDWTEHP